MWRLQLPVHVLGHRHVSKGRAKRVKKASRALTLSHRCLVGVLPYCIAVQNSTAACKIVDGWIGHQLYNLNEALSKYNRGRHSKVQPVDEADAGSVRRVSIKKSADDEEVRSYTSARAKRRSWGVRGVSPDSTTEAPPVADLCRIITRRALRRALTRTPTRSASLSWTRPRSLLSTGAGPAW